MYTYRIRWKYTLVETSRIQKLFRHIRKLLCRIQYSETTLSYSEIKKTIENLNGTLKKPQAKP